MAEETTTIEFNRVQLDYYLGVLNALQEGDWESLSKINSNKFIDHPLFIEILGYKISALMQVDNVDEAIKIIDKYASGKEEVVSIVLSLISGVYNNLGRAQVVLENEKKSNLLFSNSAEFLVSIVDKDSVVKKRKSCQIKLMKYEIDPKNDIDISLNKECEIDLGSAWAGNTINTVIFRHHGVVSSNGYQFTAFYVDENTLSVVKRRLSDNLIEKHCLLGQYNLKDAHNSISLGIDRAGHIHISYDHHSSKLKYRRSHNSLDISSWSNELSMTGANEQKVTYPTFVLPKNDSPLLMLYRDGSWKKGNAYLKFFDEDDKRWKDYPLPILSGAYNNPWTSNAYWNNPVVDEYGCLHLSYVWRTDYFSDKQLVNNINIGYAKSYDNGCTWQTINDKPYKLPITQVNSDVIWPVAPGSNLINQCSMAVDSKGFPHIAFYSNDENGVPQYQHIWYTGTIWKHGYVSNRKEGFKLAGGGTLKIPMSRPAIIIDKEDNVFIFFRSDETAQRMAVCCLKSPYYSSVNMTYKIIWDYSLEQSEPVFDFSRWCEENILTLFIQKNQQPNGDLVHVDEFENVFLVDCVITRN
ncbi:BNR repeat-containing protein [Vreelandella titanicae]|uniref:BNR repeat-containing protein n=1 Tax=Vreelandella titanicae TaxID=664683 RepID=UPI00114304A6|nr:BNR repeat-containing protein [Halomonas titanicae]